MTQPTEAVGGEAVVTDVSQPNADPIEAIVDEMLGTTEEEEQAAAEAEAAEEAGHEYEAEDEAGDEAAELPPIAPPVSWTGENKEKFAELPRDVQEYIAQREADREKFVQTKSQEAARTRTEVEKEAIQHIQRTHQERAQDLSQLLVEVPQRPGYQLQADDPYLYAEHMQAHENAIAHNQWIEQRISAARKQAHDAATVLQQQTYRETEELLRENFPEYLDPEQAPKLKEKLSAAAIRLGYTQDQLANVDGRDILAMREVANLIDKADKYDAFMKQKMETVRAGKTPPKVARPGAAQTRGQVSASRRDAAWERTKATKDPSAFADYLEASGIKL